MNKIETVINAISVPVLIVDRSLTVVSANKEARAQFPSIRIGGDTQSIGLDAPKLQKLVTDWNDSVKGSTIKLFVDNSVRHEYQVTVRGIDLSVGLTGEVFILTFKDLTPVRAAKSMRSDFVANVSHEIRSPLTAISGFVESMQDAQGIDDETRMLFLGLMEKEVVRMTSLVSDLLSLSKVEAKERRVLKKTAEVDLVLLQAYEAVTGLARGRNKQVTLKIDSELPQVTGKHEDLMRVFVNLLENAINYSSDGGRVTLTATLANKGNPLARDAICIAVQDEGEGIPPEEIPRLTERFYRVDKSRSRNVGGTGLGLAIVKHILVRHRGKLVIASEPGVGSTFSVYLPVIPQS